VFKTINKTPPNMASLLRAFSSRDEHEAEKRISKAQTKAAEESKTVIKLLILGAGGGGKSTLVSSVIFFIGVFFNHFL
jgi:predicted GTPase